VKSSEEVISEGLTEGRKAKVMDSVESVADVVNIALSLLPTSDTKGDLRGAKDKAEEFGDESNEGDTLDSLKQFYSDALQPPRPPQGESQEAAPKKSAKLKGVANSLMKQKLKEKEEQERSKVKAGWGGKFSHIVSQLENPDVKAAVQNKVRVFLFTLALAKRNH